MKPVILTTSPLFGTVGEAAKAVAEAGWEFIRCTDTSRPDGGASDRMADVEILIPGLPIVTAEMIAKAPRLKAILKHGVGVDNIDIAAATARNIPVCNAPGTNANAVAELVLADMLAISRRIPMVHADMQRGTWNRYFGNEIQGKTLGIIGLGSIGKTLALKALALGMRVVASDLYQDTAFAEKHGVTFLSLEEALRTSDYISLHVFGGKGTENLIGAAQLAMMKPTAYIVNCARGTVLDLDALSAALEKGELAGAAIDAYPTEPPQYDHPIFRSPKVIFTPHSGADTKDTGVRCGEFTLDNIKRVLAGEKPVAVCNPEVFSA